MPILTAEERVGSLLAGRYKLESILGSGGTSVVYRASHAWTGKPIALKLLKPEHARDRGLVMRFLREARSASTIVHPNVVAILDMGTDPAGDVYLAMELLEGESVGAILEREGTLSVARTIELLRPIMEAVALAHQRGVVHRDLKPDNILVGDRGDAVVRSILLDFGMAKMTEAAWGHATQSGLIVGTPFYMSPEQAEGAPDVGAQSDVWSMGVILYRCLGGALPFFGAAPTSLLLAIVRGDHRPLSERAPDLSPAICSVVERALEVDRTRRYPDMAQMIEALDAALGGTIDRLAQKSSAAAEPPEESPPPSRRALAIAFAAALVLALVGAGAVVAAGGRDVASAERSVPERIGPPAVGAPPHAPDPVTVVAPAAVDPPIADPIVTVSPDPPIAARPEPRRGDPDGRHPRTRPRSGLATEW